MEYTELQIIKHALQYYIQRQDAPERDIAKEKRLLSRIEERVEHIKEMYWIKSKQETG